jgi:hypothetical protein
LRYPTQSLLAATLLVLTAPSAIAGMENVRFCLHRKPAFVSTKAVPDLCDDPATATVEPNYSPNYENLTCDQYAVKAPLGPSTVYVVVAQAGTEGVGAVSFGVYYGSNYYQVPGQGIISSQTTWTSCANGLMFPGGPFGDFPVSESGVRITWNTSTSCANQVIGNHGVHAVVGCFYVYAYSSTVFQLTDNQSLQSEHPELGVADCLGHTTDYYLLLGPVYYHSILARVQFGEGSGAYNPCAGPVPVHPSTWGKLKNQYK